MLKECKVLLGLTLTVFLFFFTGCGDMFDFSTETPETPATPDTTKPSVTSQSPIGDTVAVNTTVSASISDPSGVYYDGFSLSAGSYSVERAPDETGLTFTPKHRLDYSTKHTATISNVRDGAENPAGDVSWSFTTASLSSLSFTVHTTPDSHYYDGGQYNSIAIGPLDGKKYISYLNNSDCSLSIIATDDGCSFDGPYTIDGPDISGGCAGRNSSLGIYSDGTTQYFHVVYLAETQNWPESVDTGDGTTKQFTAFLPYLPIKKGKIKILHDGIEVGQDDGKGNIYDSNSSDSTFIASTSTINYTTGALVLNYTQAPANKVEITATYTPDIDGVKYATKSNNISGTWQRTRIYAFIRTTNETIGTGDDATTQFKKTFTYLPVEKSTIEILHDGVKVGQDNGRGYIYDTNSTDSTSIASTSTINYTTGELVLNYTKAPAYKVAITATYRQNDDINNDNDMDADIDINKKDGRVHISFYDFKNEALRYTTNSSGSWQTPIVVDDGFDPDNPGGFTSIKVDSGTVHISYYDFVNRNLKYATNKTEQSVDTSQGCDPGWDCYTLDSTGDLGKHSSLALNLVDINRPVNITYYDYDATNSTNSRIKLIAGYPGAFVSSVVDGLSSGVSDNTAASSSFAIDDDGIMHMSYISAGKLYYASKVRSWSPSTVVDSGIGNGIYTSIAVDSNGKAHISYRDETDFDLKYAHQID